MKRRVFVYNVLCLSCLNGLLGCSNNIELSSNSRNINSKSKFYYKSKKELPKNIRIEACSMCQLSCPACDVRILEQIAPKDWLGYLKFEDFKKFVDDNDFESIELSNHGEIFLNPQLNEIIEYAYQKNIKLTAYNGVNLNTVSCETLENLVKFQFNHLLIALDGATPETYQIYRRGGDYNTVINNIKKINYYKEKYNSEYPKLTWQFILFGHNEHEIELAKKKAKELNMDIVFRKNDFLWYSPIKNKELVYKQTGVDVVSDKRADLSCPKVFLKPQIDYNGILLGCCCANLKNYRINVFKEGLLKALNNPAYIQAKHVLTDLSLTPSSDIPCSQCNDYKYIKKNNIAFNINI